MPDKPTADATHGLSVQHADALWDAVAIPGPTAPTFPMQHERVCRAVAEIIAELTPARPAVPVSSPPPDQTAVEDRVARRLAGAWISEEDWQRRPANFRAEYLAYARDVLAFVPQPEPADRAAVEAERDSLGREADRMRKDWVEMRTRAEAAEAERDAYGEQLDEAAETIAARTVEINRLTDELRRLAAEAEQPNTETQAHPPIHAWRVETRDPGTNQWMEGSHFAHRPNAVERWETANRTAPLWNNGTPVERRIVRETTTYTVDQPATTDGTSRV